MAKSEQLRRILRQAHTERDKPAAPEHWRPQVRGDCVDGPRPCPFVACRYNLLLEVTPTGSLKLPHGYPWEIGDDVASCALDVADQGEHNTEQAAEYLGNCRDVAAKGLRSAVEKMDRLKGELDR